MTRGRAQLRFRLRLLFAVERAHRRVVAILARAAEFHDGFVTGVAERWDEFVDGLDDEGLAALEELRRDEVARSRIALGTSTYATRRAQAAQQRNN